MRATLVALSEIEHRRVDAGQTGEIDDVGSSGRRSSRTTRLIVLGGVLALLGAGCGDDGNAGGQSGGGTTQDGQAGTGADREGQSEPEAITVEGERLNFHGRRDVSGGGSAASVRLESFFFDPTVLVGEPGETVQLRLRNRSRTAHTFTVREQDVDEVVGPGESARARVTMPDSGQIVFVCRFHAAQGMRGALDVPGGGDPGARQGERRPEDGGQQEGEQGGGGIY